MANFALDLARTIRLQRRRRGLSQSELGSRLKMPQSQIARIEKGESDVRLSTLAGIARALDLEPMLVPRHLIAPVRQMMGATGDSRTSRRKLVGNDPEDADEQR